jgi:hypothetical protein
VKEANMKREYLVTCVPGLQEVAAALLRRTPGLTVRGTADGAVTVRADVPPNFPYLQNVFAVLTSMTGLADLNAALTRLLRGADWLDRMPYDHLEGKRFRLVTMDRDRLVPVDMDRLTAVERAIAERTGMRLLRDRPDVELWLWRRPEGITLFGWRMQARKARKAQGALREDVCHMVAALAGTGGRPALCVYAQDNEGLLAALRAGGGGAVGLCGEEEAARVLRGRIPGARVLVGDMETPPSALQPGSLGAVVARLPQDVADRTVRALLTQAERLLMPGGRLVILALPGAVEYPLQNARGLVVADRLDFSLGGKKTALWVLRRETVDAADD